jgi:hypothetical protein
MTGPLRRALSRAWRTALHLRVPPPARQLTRVLDDPAAIPPDPSSEEAALAAVAGRLPFVAVRPAAEFRTALHERLLEEQVPVSGAPKPPLPDPDAAAEETDAEVATDRRPALSAGVRTVVLVGAAGVALVGGATAAVAASGDALPGQPLYAAKRGVEQVQLALTFETVARGERLLELADVRVEEAEQLLDRDGSTRLTENDIAAVNEALSGAHRRVVEADDVLLTAYRLSGDPEPAQSLDAVARDLHDRLEALPEGAPELEASSAALAATLEQVLLRTSSISQT